MNEQERTQGHPHAPSAHQPHAVREAPVPARRRYQLVPAAARSAPHTRPGDQNALCIETDQA
jgi:hypothetical protein